MDARVRRFRKQAEEENGDRSGRRRRYSRELRADAVAYFREQMKGGASGEAVASELGVSGWTLSRWSRGSSGGKSATVQPVKVVRVSTEVAAAKPQVTLVTPDGYRVQGLEQRDVGAILESLR